MDFVIDICREYPEIRNVLCGVNSAYCESGTVSQEFFERTNIYYHRLQWTEDLKKVNDQILKFAPTVPEENAARYVCPSNEEDGVLVTLEKIFGEG